MQRTKLCGHWKHVSNLILHATLCGDEIQESNHLSRPQLSLTALVPGHQVDASSEVHAQLEEGMLTQ
jgi:hypothetical protein